MRNTKIVHQVTLKHMKMNMKRTVLSVVGITLMVMLLTTVLVGKDTACQYFIDLSSAQNGAYHFAVYDIDKEKLSMIKGLDAVEQVGVTEDLKYSWFDKTGKAEKPFLNIRRYSAEAMKWMNIKAVEGRLPENVNEIVISRSALDEGSSIKIGDTIEAETFKRFMTNNNTSGSTVIASPRFEIPAGEKVEVPYNMFYFVPGTEFGDEFYETHDEIHENTGFKQSYTVVGFIEQPVFEKPGCAWYAAVSPVDESTVYGETFNALLMTDTKKVNSSLHTQLMDIAGDKNYDSNSGVLIFSGSSDDNSLNYIVTAAQAFFVILIVLISIMLIYNVFALSYDERVKYLGMLSSVGATGRQKRSSVYFEAMVLLVPSIPSGILLGLGLTKLASKVAAPIAQKLFFFEMMGKLDIEPALKVSPAVIAAITVLSIATVFVSALIPAHKISTIGPVESIRGNKKSSKKHSRNFDPDKLIMKSSEGMLASRFLKNDKSKSLGIIRAVTIFILVTTVVYFAASLLVQMVGYKLDDSGVGFAYYNDRDYALVHIYDGPGRYDPSGLIETVKTMDGVKNYEVCKVSNVIFSIPNEELSDEYRDAFYKIISLYYPAGQYSREKYEESISQWPYENIRIFAFEDETFGKLAKELNAADYGTADMPCILINDASISTDQYGIHGRKARDYKYLQIDNPFKPAEGETIHVRPGGYTRKEALEKGLELDEMAFPEIELDEPLGLKVISKAKFDQIEEYIMGSNSSALCLIVPMSVADYLDKVTVNKMDTEVFFDCDNSDTVERLSNTAEDLYSQGEYIHFVPTTNSAAGYKQIIGYLIRIVLSIFTAVASAICLLNVYSSISALMVSRRKNIAVLKSIGSTFRQLVRTGLRESLGMLIRSILIAAPLIALICRWLATTLVSRFGYFTVSFPWLEAAGLIVFISAAVLLMTYICLRRENKIDIIDEIKRESV